MIKMNFLLVKERLSPGTSSSRWKMKDIVSFFFVTIITQLSIIVDQGGVSSFIITSSSSSSVPKRRRRRIPSTSHVNRIHSQTKALSYYDSHPSSLIVINYALSDDDNDDLEENEERSSAAEKSNISWLKDAMGIKQKEEATSERSILPLEEGLAGFAVDSKLGFVAILASSFEDKVQKATYVVISPQDRQRVMSAEALCMVQLAGGLDLATTIFPPDILAKLAVGEVDDVSSTQELRKRITLLDIQVVPNDDHSSNSNNNKKKDMKSEEDGTYYSSLISSKERERQIIQSAPKVLKAIKGLPGLQECTIGDVLEGLQTHANSIGEIDQTTFPNLLETLRQGKRGTTSSSVMKQSHIKFLLKVNFLENDKVSQPTIVAPTPLHAIGLSMRYKIPLKMDDKCFLIENSNSSKVCFDASDILTKFPQLRPLQELREDAAIMDGFIPSMFVKASYLKNDDKES